MPPVSRPSSNQAVALLGILLIATNLRAPITGLPPLLEPIRTTFGLGATAAGALTTLPLLAFAVLSPFAAGLARRHGLERALGAALVTIALGIALRPAGAAWCLYLGTGLIGMGIAIGNVLLPSLVKRDFPHAIARLTGAYALTMGIAAGLGSALIVPLAHMLGWRWALLAFLGLPLVALMAWRVPAHAAPAPGASTAPQGSVWRSALAWQVTLFLGLNSTIYYVAVGWLPTMLVEGGMSAEQAGTIHGAMQLATALPGLAMGALLHRMHDQRLPAAVVAGLALVALLGLLWLPQHALYWAILFGLGTGGGIILGLSFIGLRTGTAGQAAALSGMSQYIGYLLAAAGPMAMAALHDIAGNWRLPLATCAALACATLFVGLLAGRQRRIAA